MPTHSLNVLLIDNFDSFTGNIYDALKKLGASVDVKRQNFNLSHYDRIVIGPGPGNPEDLSEIGKLIPKIESPLLGICLGHQLLAYTYGGTFQKAQIPCHGKAFSLSHKFLNFPQNMEIGRYHSLVVNHIPDCLEITAMADGYIMAIKHKTLKQCGLQFHPDSFLTQFGDQFFEEFLTYGEIRCLDS